MRYFGALLGLLLSVGCTTASFDQRMASKVVQILNSKGSSCSGELVEGVSGATYILTAAHCRELSEGGLYKVRSEAGATYYLPLVAEDDKSDLLLIQAYPGAEGLKPARVSYRSQRIITFTHGSGLNTYRTDGILIQERSALVGMFPIDSSEAEQRCLAAPKYKIVPDLFGSFCVMDVPLTFSTAFIAPGSSGGPIVNESGELVGVVSAGGQGFGLFVRLTDIRAFLSKF